MDIYIYVCVYIYTHTYMYTYTYIQVRFLGWEDHLEKAMATHSSILNRRISGTEELVGYSPWDHRVGHNWAANTKSPLWWSILFFIAYSVFFSFGISFCIFFFLRFLSLCSTSHLVHVLFSWFYWVICVIL